MNNSHVADAPASQALYTTPAHSPEIDRTTGSKHDGREPAEPMKGTGELVAARKEGRGGAEVPKIARLQ